jgi:FkbM family methyltransferase
MKLHERIRKVLYYLRSYAVTSPGKGEISLTGLIDFFSATRKRIAVVQVGANDGVTNDPLHRFLMRDGWQGVLLEPQREVFEKALVPAYRNHPRIKLENAAIAAETGTKALYKIAFSTARWATGLATFEKKSIVNLIRSGYVDQRAKEEGVVPPASAEAYISTEEINTITFGQLLAKYGLTEVDVLAIDTEGFDFEIIKLFDLNALKPDMILFENIHLPAGEYEACKRHLASFGYKLYQKGPNTIALQRNARNFLQMLVT